MMTPVASNAGSPSILTTGGRLPSTETITALAETVRVLIKRSAAGSAVEVLRHSPAERPADAREVEPHRPDHDPRRCSCLRRAEPDDGATLVLA